MGCCHSTAGVSRPGQAVPANHTMLADPEVKADEEVAPINEGQQPEEEEPGIIVEDASAAKTVCCC